jgi:hypothetical protein
MSNSANNTEAVDAYMALLDYRVRYPTAEAGGVGSHAWI